MIDFSETIAPWLVGLLLLLALALVVMTVKSWREMKRSPYFFMRRQAEKKFQRYSLTSLVLFIAIGIISVYAFPYAPVNDYPRVAILTNTKPPKEDVVQLFDDAAITEEVEAEPEAISADLLGTVNTAVVNGETESLEETELALPEEYNQFEPAVDLQADTQLSKLNFSTEIDENYEAVNPRNLFGEGFFTVYATFAYEDMADGMAWAWVWRYNGEVIDGGNELWAYGDDGPGYIYLSPEEGFQNGEYELDVWVNGELLTSSSVVMNNAAVSAGN